MYPNLSPLFYAYTFFLLNELFIIYPLTVAMTLEKIRIPLKTRQAIIISE
jgi:hypothetical protein